MGSSAAEDVVHLKPAASGRSPTRIAGTITEYTGRELRIRTAGERENSIPAERVERISTPYTERHTAADRLFAQKRYAEALALYKQAVGDEPRVWVRRELLANIVWCLRNQDEWEQAGATFLLIVQSDPATRHLDAMPLVWRPMALTPAMERRATEWLRDEAQPAARLVAASWLLASSPQHRAQAAQALDELTRIKDSHMAQLAEAQLWRVQLVTASESDIPRWQAAVERMPPPLRAGPYFLLGQAQKRHGRHVEAALSLMRVPILFPRERTLAAESLLAAADALQRSGRQEEAQSCLRELLAEYPATEAAAAAKSKSTPVPRGG